MPLRFGLREFARALGAPPATVESWLASGVLSAGRGPGGEVLLFGGAEDLVTVAMVTALAAAGLRGKRLAAGGRLVADALEQAHRRGGHAWLVADLADGRLFAFATLDPRDPVPEAPSHRLIPLSRLEREYQAALERAAADGEEPARVIEAARADVVKALA